jgi:hypothetical protein
MSVTVASGVFAEVNLGIGSGLVDGFPLCGLLVSLLLINSLLSGVDVIMRAGAIGLDALAQCDFLAGLLFVGGCGFPTTP